MPYDLDRNPFWDFSVEFYRRPGVAKACLRLQTSLGIDINLLLFGVWQAEDGRNEVTPAMFKNLIEATANWHESVVRVMRRARQVSKSGHPLLSPAEANSCYQSILGAELGTERYEQLIIVRSAERLERSVSSAASNDIAHSNMDAYLQAASLCADNDDRTALDDIASATMARPPI